MDFIYRELCATFLSGGSSRGSFSSTLAAQRGHFFSTPPDVVLSRLRLTYFPGQQNAFSESCFEVMSLEKVQQTSGWTNKCAFSGGS